MEGYCKRIDVYPETGQGRLVNRFGIDAQLRYPSLRDQCRQEEQRWPGQVNRLRGSV